MKNNSKDIILLNIDKTLLRKDEKKLTKKDIILSQYILVSTELDAKAPSKNYVLIESSPLLLFKYAIVEYQLAAISYCFSTDFYGKENLEPVCMETDSLTDVISILNCIDRLNCMNNQLTGSSYGMDDEETLCVDIEYFKVLLLDEKRNVIYNKVYQDKNSYKENYFSFAITNKFSEIYPSNIIPKMAKKRRFLLLYEDRTWEIESDMSKYGLIGIPLLVSNTVTFCNYDEYNALRKYEGMDTTTCIIDIQKDFKKEFSELLLDANYPRIEEISSNLDYFIIKYMHHPLKGLKEFMHLDLLVNIGFVINMTNLVFNYLYPEFGYIPETVICATLLTDKKKKKMVTFYFNEDSILSIHQILNII